MPDEVFRRTMEVTDAERLLIHQVWMDMLHRNRWRRRGWRLLHRLRVLCYPRSHSRKGSRRFLILALSFWEQNGAIKRTQMRRRWRH